MNRTILIVDDSSVERTVLSGFLHSDYNVIEAKSGEEAIEIIEKKFNSISAVIMDVVMPGIDGFKTLKKIKANPMWQALPVIITTSLDDDEFREKAIINGADNFITKPYNRALLLYVVQNVIKLRETAAIAHTLFRDNLTGLLSRNSFFAEAERMIKRHELGYYIISCFDVDNFKVINDQYGTDVGDNVLKYIANCISGFVADINGLTCRYTADKFAVLYPAKIKDSESQKENHKKVTMPDCINRTIRAHIGRYLINDLSIPVSAMFDRAAMAQDSIKNRYDVYIADYTDSMREQIINEQKIVNNMAGALENNEFEPWFQPQYNHATGELIGAEALVRWRKNGKLVAPCEFIPVFERNGFIYEMDKNILEQVCVLMRKWIDEEKNPLPVSINISRKDLFHEHFISILTGIVNKYKLPYELIRLEVTESAFADSSIVNLVDELIGLGFTVEIDDFGSGYSSLNTLKDVPASILKLDMRFFEDTKNTERGGNIIESVVRMAKWLGMSIIAEGVEEKTQADYLKSIGCYYIQGYFYAKPMPAKEYEKVLESDKKTSKLEKLETLNTLDNNEFWNPKSIETLIFNSYVGGACIYEYHKGKTELLRMNEQYTKEMGGLISPGVQLIDAGMLKFMSDIERNKLHNVIREAIKTGKEASSEICISDGKQTEYVRITNRVIARAGDRYLLYGVVLNVTEQRTAEIKEHNMAVQFSAMLNNMRGAVSASTFNENGEVEFLFTNKRFYEMYGYTEEQYKKEVKDVMSIVHPDDREKALKIIKKTVETHGTATHEFRCYKRDGSLMWQQNNDSVIELEGYDKPVLLAVADDITELKLSKQREAESFENLTTVLNYAGTGIAAFDLKESGLETIFANKKYYEFLGYTKEEYQYKNIIDVISLIYPDDLQLIKGEVRSAVNTKEETCADVRILHKSGEYRLFHVTAHVIPKENGISTLLFSYVPITEQAKKLQKMNFELNTLLYTIPSGVFKYSADEKEEFEYINRNFIESLGYTDESFKEKFHNCFREMVYEEDRENVEYQIMVQEGNGGIGKFDYRVAAADGTLHWFHDEGVKVTDENGKEWYYVTLVDVTEQKEMEENLRLAEEEYRIATRHSGHTIGRYSIADRTLAITEEAEERLDLPKIIEDVPYGRVRRGKISSETSDAYIAFYEDIMHGKKEGSVTFQKLLSSGWRWITEHSTTIFDEKGKAVAAIISYKDVTEHQEKEIAFKKWKQELDNKKTDTFTLYRLNLSKNSSYVSVDGTLLDFVTDKDETIPLNERTKDFAMQCVVEEDRDRYISFVNADVMLANYYRGKKNGTIEFRARISNSKVHWLRLTIDLVEYPNSSDVEAYLMYDDINDSKVVELTTKEQAETDSLTGLLNRKTFAAKLDEIISCKNKKGLTALFLIDMDGFKQVNDNFGHSVGDQVLIDAGKAIRSIVYGADLVCRIGGDEFIVCVRDMPDCDVILKKAKQICALTRRSFSFGVQLTVSIGISVFPKDGETFDALYQKADKALYSVKGRGKNNCAFYSKDMEQKQIDMPCAAKPYSIKNRMLIVDDNESSRLYLEAVFKDEFKVDCVDDGEAALEYLQKYSNEVAIVLLDLMMPEISGFTVLDRMHENRDTQLIPVIVVSGIDDRETNLRALRCGAYDFVPKPVDPDLLRIRINSAIERSEVEYLRLQNEFLSIQRDEMEKIKKILENDGTIIVEYETENGAFRYDSKIAEVLSGVFDARPLWNILADDMVSSKSDAETLKSLILRISENMSSESAVIKLRKKSGEAHLFRIKAMRCDDKIRIYNKILITFTDIEALTK